MKTYISKATLVAFAMGLFFAFTSCQKQENLTADIGSTSNSGAVMDQDQDVTLDDIRNLPESVMKKVADEAASRGIDLDQMEEVLVTRPNGEVQRVFMVEGDIEMTPQQFREMVMMQDDDRQYSTNVVANNNRTYTVIGYTGACCALTPKMQTGLQWAVANINALPLGITLSLSFGTDYTNKDITVYNNGQSGGGGSAGFPFSNGQPYNFVQIRAGTDAFSTNVNEHVACHEILHCLGFRHTDWFNRSISCGSGGSEGTAGVGANQIPGTPGTSGVDLNSIMLSCFNSGVNGELSSFDRVAMEYLFPD